MLQIGLFRWPDDKYTKQVSSLEARSSWLNTRINKRCGKRFCRFVGSCCLRLKIKYFFQFHEICFTSVLIFQHVLQFHEFFRNYLDIKFRKFCRKNHIILLRLKIKLQNQTRIFRRLESNFNQRYQSIRKLFICVF